LDEGFRLGAEAAKPIRSSCLQRPCNQPVREE
jgi:hypothetical protein